MSITTRQQNKMVPHQQGPTPTTILVTGGAGYVGSHSVLLLLERNYSVVVVDNCSNAHLEEGDDQDQPQWDSNGNNVVTLPESLRRVQVLARKPLTAFYNVDLLDLVELDRVFRRHPGIGAVIHFAALKSVAESIQAPLEYYTNNLIGTVNLLNTMKLHGCRNLIFSSSATVYGLPEYNPVDEQHPTGRNILNPYGRTKFMIEQMLQDLCRTVGSSSNNNNNNNNHDSTGKRWNIISLRYFNPTGAHPSGYIGEHTQGTPNNLMPYVSQVSIGKRDKLYVFGNDFDTADGTGVRDYIHIMDLASGHVCALDYLFKQLDTNGTNQSTSPSGLEVDNSNGSNSFRAFNLGTGKGYSVLEVIRTYGKVNNVRIPYELIKRREGDAGEVYADVSLANRELNWSARHSLVDMCRDTYRWQIKYPEGFKSRAYGEGQPKDQR